MTCLKTLGNFQIQQARALGRRKSDEEKEEVRKLQKQRIEQLMRQILGKFETHVSPKEKRNNVGKTLAARLREDSKAGKVPNIQQAVKDVLPWLQDALDKAMADEANHYCVESWELHEGEPNAYDSVEIQFVDGICTLTYVPWKARLDKMILSLDLGDIDEGIVVVARAIIKVTVYMLNILKQKPLVCDILRFLYGHERVLQLRGDPNVKKAVLCIEEYRIYALEKRRKWQKKFDDVPLDEYEQHREEKKVLKDSTQLIYSEGEADIEKHWLYLMQQRQETNQRRSEVREESRVNTAFEKALLRCRQTESCEELTYFLLEHLLSMRDNREQYSDRNKGYIDAINAQKAANNAEERAYKQYDRLSREKLQADDFFQFLTEAATQCATRANSEHAPEARDEACNEAERNMKKIIDEYDLAESSWNTTREIADHAKTNVEHFFELQKYPFEEAFHHHSGFNTEPPTESFRLLVNFKDKELIVNFLRSPKPKWVTLSWVNLRYLFFEGRRNITDFPIPDLHKMTNFMNWNADKIMAVLEFAPAFGVCEQ